MSIVLLPPGVNPIAANKYIYINVQLFQKLSQSYMFRHYRVILRELVINTLPSYTSISNAAVGNTFNGNHPVVLYQYNSILISLYTTILIIKMTSVLKTATCFG
jgi:hypothetical protein